MHPKVQAVVALSGSGVALHQCSILVLLLNTKEPNLAPSELYGGTDPTDFSMILPLISAEKLDFK